MYASCQSQHSWLLATDTYSTFKRAVVRILDGDGSLNLQITQYISAILSVSCGDKILAFDSSYDYGYLVSTIDPTRVFIGRAYCCGHQRLRPALMNRSVPILLSGCHWHLQSTHGEGVSLDSSPQRSLLANSAGMLLHRIHRFNNITISNGRGILLYFLCSYLLACLADG